MIDPQIAGEFTAALRLHYGPGPHPGGAPQSVHAGGQPKAPVAGARRPRTAGTTLYDSETGAAYYIGDDGRRRDFRHASDAELARLGYVTGEPLLNPDAPYFSEREQRLAYGEPAAGPAGAAAAARADVKSAGAAALNHDLGLAAGASPGGWVQDAWAFSSSDSGDWQDQLQLEAYQRAAQRAALQQTDGMRDAESSAPGGVNSEINRMIRQARQDYREAHGPTATLADVRRAAFDSIYERTQAHLWRVGRLAEDDEITIYRGFETYQPLPTDAAGAPVIQWRPLSSFSLKAGTAGVFSSMSSVTDFKHGYVVAYRVPRKAIFAHWASGFGCAPEQEVVVLGDYLRRARGTIVAYKEAGAFDWYEEGVT